MTPHREKELFDQALDLDPAERAAFVRRECSGDAVLCDRMIALLAAHDVTTAFLPQQPRTLAVTPEDLPGEAPGDVLGRYKLLERVGEGGCGVVYVAEQTEPVRRRVALKVIKLGMDTRQVVARFEAERQALALMDHPNIAKVLDAGATELGRPYFVMELVRGIPITHYCDQNQLGTQARLDLFIQVCHAIQHAHQKGVIHRDIKPSNILVTVNDGQPVPKVIDFGIAKATEGRLTDATIYTQLHQFIGTPAYMSPEQAEMTSLDIDTRSDIYSLGVLLYELLAGRTPFEAKDLMAAGLDAMRRIVREQEPARPSTRLATLLGDELSTTAKRRSTEPPKLVRQLQGDLDWIVMKCLEKDRTRRYETANGLAADLTRHRTNEPVLARPPSTAYRLQKACRRNRAAFAVAALIAVVLLGATAFSAWQARIARAAGRKVSDALALVTAERDAKEKARHEAETISTFLTRAFQSPNPAHDGRTVTVAEMLDKTVRKLDTDLAAQPAQRALLQSTLAETYVNLGLHPEAVLLAEKVREYRLATSGPEHPDTLRAMRDLAYCYFQAGRHDEALKLREEVAARFSQVLGPEHPEVLHSITYLAYSYFVAGRMEEALRLQERALELHRKVNGPEHPDTLQAMATLALSRNNAGRRDEALKLQEEVLALSRKVHGPEHPVTLALLSELGSLYSGAGRRDEGLRLHEEVLSLRRRVLGPEHPDTLLSVMRLARDFGNAGRIPEAINLQEEAVRLARRIHGPDHAITLSVLSQFTDFYQRAGRWDEAIRLGQEEVAAALRIPGAESQAEAALARLWTACFKAGRPAEGIQTLEQAVRVSPPGTIAAMKLAAFQLWTGDTAGYAGTRDRMLQWAASTTNASVADRVAKLVSLDPSPQPASTAAALVLARRSVELGQKERWLPYFEMSLGLAEYRQGDDAAANRWLESARRQAPTNASAFIVAGWFQSMCLFRQGRVTEARRLFGETASRMKPLPAAGENPPVKSSDENDLVAWLVFREARALLGDSAPTPRP